MTSTAARADGATSPLWISHRGCTALYDENTEPAFREAVRSGFTALEADLRLSADGHLVICHDLHLRRLAGDPRSVAQTSRAELEKVRLRKGGKLLFLDEFVAAFPAVSWTLDIKPEGGERTIARLIEWFEINGLRELLTRSARFVTWHARHERLLIEKLGPVECYARKHECVRAGLAARARLTLLGGIRPGRIYALPPDFYGLPLFKRSLVERLRRRGAKSIAYLPGTADQLRQAFAAGFDQILTNLPPPKG